MRVTYGCEHTSTRYTDRSTSFLSARSRTNAPASSWTTAPREEAHRELETLPLACYLDFQSARSAREGPGPFRCHEATRMTIFLKAPRSRCWNAERASP